MRSLLLILLMLNLGYTFAQVDPVGSGRALQFDGVDDYVDLGNIYDDLQFPFTISAWVKLNTDDTGGPIFVSQNNLPIYNGFWFFVSPTSVSIEYGDGLGENLPNYRRGKFTSIPDIRNRWVHVCAIVKGISNISLFVNGNEVAGDQSGQSLLPMASNFPDDIATIGYFLSNGREYFFRGELDHVQLYKKELLVEEVRARMSKKLRGNEVGLIGHWHFDETSNNQVNDISPNHFHGILKGGVTRNFSGAPIGDESIFLYGYLSETKIIDFRSLTVTGFTGNPRGVHVYYVGASPSQTAGLQNAVNEYYGIFLADTDAGKFFTVKQLTGTLCKAFMRDDNSDPTWTVLNSNVFADRVETITANGQTSFDVNLGPDVVVCDNKNILIDSHLDPSRQILKWSTGETTSSIYVTKPGTYFIEVTQDCVKKRDSVTVTFLTSPPTFTLGEDQFLCKVEPKVLRPELAGEYSYEWQDGSNGTDFTIATFGTYSLTVRNACGQSSDTLEVKELPNFRYEIPNVITPNGDNDNQFFVVTPLIEGNHLTLYNRWGKTVYKNESYDNSWDGQGLAGGRYFYTFKPRCGPERKGVISIVR